MRSSDAALVARLVEAPLPPGFERCHLEIAPGCCRTAVPAGWSQAPVVVTAGDLEVVCAHAGTLQHTTGQLLVLDLLPRRALYIPGTEATRPVAVSRGTSRP